MNERQSIEESIELWEVLASDGNLLRKRDVPGPWLNYYAYCPLCEFAKKCSNCPVFCNKNYPAHCMDRDSPFTEWMYALTCTGKARAASKMVKLFRRALKNV